MSGRDNFDICIIGAGVVGLAIASELANSSPGQSISIVVLERESSFGQHTSSRNSEVIHAGIYYPSDSLKAQLCVTGKEMLYAHCEQYQVPHSRIGKLIVAGQSELQGLEDLNQRAIANGVTDLQFLKRAELQKTEPAVEADAALFSPSTGIIDSHGYMQSLLHRAQMRGVQFSPYTRVEAVTESAGDFVVHCQIDEHRNPQRYEFSCQRLVNAAGLDAHELAAAIEPISKSCVPQVHYCKGDYFEYAGKNPFKHLIYPMPESNTAGLGIHATLDMGSRLKFGPDTEYVQQLDFAIDQGKATAFAQRIKSYFPAIREQDLRPAYAGIRPKLAAAGEPAADFLIQGQSDHGVSGLVQLFGMESPGLTASLAIAKYVENIL